MNLSERKVIVVLGDVVSSRQIHDRGAFQRKLSRLLEEVTRTSSGLLTRYAIALGDEFEAVYERADRLPADLWRILARLHPQKVRFAVSVGTLATPVSWDEPTALDGPAFHAAREAVASLKDHGSRDAPPRLFTVAGVVGPQGPVLNHSLDLLSHLCADWRANRWGVLDGLLAGKSAAEIADGLDISPAAVYKNIHAGALETLLALNDDLARALNEAAEGT
ncbi:MAG: SatD family protein [Planctomycetota bacterium]